MALRKRKASVASMINSGQAALPKMNQTYTDISALAVQCQQLRVKVNNTATGTKEHKQAWDAYKRNVTRINTHLGDITKKMAMFTEYNKQFATKLKQLIDTINRAHRKQDMKTYQAATVEYQAVMKQRAEFQQLAQAANNIAERARNTAQPYVANNRRQYVGI